MFLSRRSIAKLGQKCTDARNGIRDLVHKMEIVLPDDQIAWGQFLDDGRNKRQFGVLGTSAAIQVLSSMGTAATSVQRAQQTLPYLSVSESPKCQHELNDRTSTFKVLAALDAYEPTTKKFDSQVAYPLAANYLLNAQIENEGWGNYFRSDADRDDKSAVEPTALTLIALHRFGRCIADERCTKALDWLSGELEPRQTESPAADALGVLAFSKFEGSESKSERVSLAHQNCVVRLSQWRKTPRDIAFHSEYHYEIPDGFGGGESKYIFFPVAILVALALLKSQYSKSSDRTWAARVCQEVAARVRRDGGFRVWGHVSTVDQ